MCVFLLLYWKPSKTIQVRSAKYLQNSPLGLFWNNPNGLLIILQKTTKVAVDYETNKILTRKKSKHLNWNEVMQRSKTPAETVTSRRRQQKSRKAVFYFICIIAKEPVSFYSKNLLHSHLLYSSTFCSKILALTWLHSKFCFWKFLSS